jgi:signal transduction histidine kinase
MPSDRLQDLLREADAEFGIEPRPTADLARRVQARVRRRRSRRQIARSAAAAVVLVLAIGWPELNQPAPKQTPTVTEPVVVVEHPQHGVTDPVLRRLEIAAGTHAAAARLLRDPQRPPTATVVVSVSDTERVPAPVAAARTARNRAAETLVRSAQQLEHELPSPASAIAGYRQAVKLFPESVWATVARSRLLKLNAL